MKEKMVNLLLPPIEKVSPIHILVPLLLGIVIKYVFGGSILDLIGHLIIFLSAMNTKNLVEKYLGKELNLIIGLLIIGGSFILMQMFGITIVDNLLGIEPIFR